VSLVNTVKEEVASIKDVMNAQNSEGNQVIKSLNEINNLITKIRDESTTLLSSGETIIKDIHSLKAI
jgi:ferritin